jgi:hypothetical protein
LSISDVLEFAEFIYTFNWMEAAEFGNGGTGTENPRGKANPGLILPTQ